MYLIEYKKRAIRMMSKLPLQERERIIWKIEETKEDPHHFFLRLTASETYRLRVGDYRIIADIDDSTRMIRIHIIAHRKKVYD